MGRVNVDGVGIEVTGEGHWMQLDAPDQVNALLADSCPADRRPGHIIRQG